LKFLKKATGPVVYRPAKGAGFLEFLEPAGTCGWAVSKKQRLLLGICSGNT
jgi:hypothetical protein